MWNKIKHSLLKRLALTYNEVEYQVESIEEEKSEKEIYLQQYQDALQDRDPEAMEQALSKVKKVCKQANSNCLNEVFCPECPFGSLIVACGRHGL